jgi:hypothetical protein
MVRFIFVVGVVVAVAYPSWGHTTEKAIHPASHRICYVKIGDTPKRSCKQLVYFQNFPLGNSSVIAKTDDGDFSFSGPEVDPNTILVKGLYVGRPLKGNGTCKLAKSAKRRLSTVDCNVQTELGAAILKSTGDEPNDLAVRLGEKITNAEHEKRLHDHPSSKQSSE